MCYGEEGSEVHERQATDVHAQFSGWIKNVTRIAFGQSAARAQNTNHL